MPPKIDTFQKQKILLKENLISPLKTNIFENGDHLLQKWKKFFKIGVSARFSLLPVKHT